MTIAFTCHPIERLKLGRYQFEKSSLKFESEAEAEEFRKHLKLHPPLIQAKIKELNVAEADKLAAKFLAGRRVTGIDTTRNSIGAPQPQANGQPSDPVEGEGSEGADSNVNDAADPADPAAANPPRRIGIRSAE